MIYITNAYQDLDPNFGNELGIYWYNLCFLNIKLDYEHTFNKRKKTRFKKYIYLNITQKVFSIHF